MNEKVIINIPTFELPDGWDIEPSNDRYFVRHNGRIVASYPTRMDAIMHALGHITPAQVAAWFILQMTRQGL